MKQNHLFRYGLPALSALAALGLTSFVTAQPASTSGHAKKPNIVFILVDNVGWGTFGCYGGTIPTPRIDKMASEGIRFNNYNVESQCTPSRSAILTGRYSTRSGTYAVPLPGQGLAGLAPWEYTTAELLSDAGYATALYGKWHLGSTQGRLPNDQGFDEWWGIKDTWDEAAYTSYPLFKESGMPVPMIYEGKKGEPSKPVMPLDLTVRPIVDGKYIIPKTIEFIKRNAAAKKPFYVYVGYSEVHFPIMSHPDYAGKSTKRGGVYADVVAEMDDRLGQVLDAIKEAGIDDNTIVIFSSDNGSGGFVQQLGGSMSGARSSPAPPPTRCFPSWISFRRSPASSAKRCRPTERSTVLTRRTCSSARARREPANRCSRSSARIWWPCDGNSGAPTSKVAAGRMDSRASTTSRWIRTKISM